MVTCCEKGCSKQSRLNKSVYFNKLPSKKIKDKRDTWIKAMNRSVLHKTIHVCSVYSMKDSSNESQELKRLLHGDVSIPTHWKIGNKAGPSKLILKDTETIEFRKVENFLFDFCIKNFKKEDF